MKKTDLLKLIDEKMIEKLFGFCYARTNDSYEAQELCSDIIFELCRTANRDGDIESPYPFIWRVARNVYARFSEKRRRRDDIMYQGDAEEILPFIADNDADADCDDQLSAVYRRIAFLTRAYREVMIMFYIDGLSTAEIAKRVGTSEGAVRQRLFSARKRVRNEVEEMEKTYNKPVALDNIDFVIWGTGDPGWGDPKTGFQRQFSKHIVWLCRKKPVSASEIAAELNVPTVYVEEELEILARGENGEYGLLRRLDGGKYIINFVLLGKDEMETANAIYTEYLPTVSDIISDHIERRKEDYLAFPYLNKKVDLNLVLWQQIFNLAHIFSSKVQGILSEKYFSDVPKVNRPFSVFGYVDNGKYYGGGCDGFNAACVCGYSEIYLQNIYITRIKKHFGCGHNVSADPQLLLALRAIDGLDIGTLSETEKEHAAKAIECGYLYREGEMLYTKVLVCDMKDLDKLYAVSGELSKEDPFAEKAEEVAAKIAELICATVPEYLLGEWNFANILAYMPMIDALVESLIEKGTLVPPEDGIGAEGCWMAVKK